MEMRAARGLAASGHDRAGVFAAMVLTGIAGVIGFGAASLGAQPAAQDGPAFEAVSVKRNLSGNRGGTAGFRGSRYSAVNITLRQLVLNAYRVLDAQVATAPQLGTADFMKGEHFDIEAAVPEGTPPAQYSILLRRLLADYFRVVTHNETREMPVYALVRARPTGP